jgi:hypothetical protein
MPLKVGDIVKHNLSGEILRILKVSECLAVCQHPPYSYKLGWTWSEGDRYICQIDNLVLHTEGKVIFDWLDSFGDNSYTRIIKRQAQVLPGTQLSLI